LTHVDLYGLFAFEDARQMGIGAIHGIGNFALNTASAASTIGWGLSSPFRAVSWITGRSSFSQDWSAFQRSNASFHASGERWMHGAFPGNVNHEGYRTMRSGISGGMELGIAVLGGTGIAKGAYSLVQKGFSMSRGMVAGQKIGRPAMPMTSALIGEMQQVAKTGKRNRLVANLQAGGTHTVFRRNYITGKVTHGVVA
jgi:hypothetical protein